jgi:uncharacterized cysteine cluster protein YcgN (CxxCxxCC family)
MTDSPFWKTKSLCEMNAAQWESLCDGCARCCLHKLEDAETGEVFYTNVVCRLLNLESCSCTDYPNRHERVPQCVHIPADKINDLHWMPSSCAYRLLYEGRSLPQWHPLITGKRETVHEAGMSVRYMALHEYDGIDLESHITNDIE